MTMKAMCQRDMNVDDKEETIGMTGIIGNSIRTFSLQLQLTIIGAADAVC